MPILIFAIGFLAIAVLTSVSSTSPSIASIVDHVARNWIGRPGVVAVFDERTPQGTVIVVQVLEGYEADTGLPGEIAGVPIRIRVGGPIFMEGTEEFGVLTGAAGIRGVPTFSTFSPEEEDRMRREEAAEGHVFTSVAPPGF